MTGERGRFENEDETLRERPKGYHSVFKSTATATGGATATNGGSATGGYAGGATATAGIAGQDGARGAAPGADDPPASAAWRSGGIGDTSGGGGGGTFDPPSKKQRGQPTRADKIALGQLKGDAAQGRQAVFNWSIYTIPELIKFRDEITQALPALELKEFNLEEEVLLQFHLLRALQGDVLDDKEVPVNQRAQVANSVASTLKTLGDQQIALYSSERFKAIENALIRELDKLPEELAAAFLENYAQVLKKFS